MSWELPYRGRKVAILGLARSGKAAASVLIAAGADVLGWDDSEAARADCDDIPLVDLAQEDPTDWAALILSPGIPYTHPAPHPVVAKARAAGVRVIGDLELLWEMGSGAEMVGITGTNGKSTTTALVGHILNFAGASVAVGGNLGTPVLQLPKLDARGHYVIECSSFQLDLLDEMQFSVAVLLNLTADHLDRHGSMGGYIDAKKRIFQRQGVHDVAVVCIDDAPCRKIAEELSNRSARLIKISAEEKVPGGVYVIDGWMTDDLEAEPQRVLDLSTIDSLPGQHNWQNAAAAYAACRALGLASATILEAIPSFPGLQHRQELVGTLGDVRFVNDSKGTNADAAAKALGCYDHIHWIAGGVAKAGGISTLEPYFPRIAHAYLIGEATDSFAQSLDGKVPYTRSGTLEAALAQAAAAAATDEGAKRPVVLLSPACASFDQFKNFEARGDAFCDLVFKLIEEAE